MKNGQKWVKKALRMSAFLDTLLPFFCPTSMYRSTSFFSHESISHIPSNFLETFLPQHEYELFSNFCVK